MPTLYGVYRSRASRPLWLLHEASVAFDHVPVIQAYRLPGAAMPGVTLDTTSPTFLQINPQGQIPAMVDGDLVLTESLGITLYLAQRYCGVLGPQDAAENALMTQWALFAATAIETPALEIMMAPQGEMGEATLAVSAEKLRRPLARLNGHLARHGGMLGRGFTAADIVVAECVRYAMAHPTLIAEFPQVEAWIKTCHARPGFQKMWAGRLAEPA